MVGYIFKIRRQIFEIFFPFLKSFWAKGKVGLLTVTSWVKRKISLEIWKKGIS